MHTATVNPFLQIEEPAAVGAALAAFAAKHPLS
jgi:hypothetical protein